MKKLLTCALLLLASCAPKVYEATFTKRKIGPDEVRTMRVIRIDKRGWLTSDRLHVYKEDGTLEVLTGRWDVKMEKAE